MKNTNTVNLGPFNLAQGAKPVIIAEAGINHNGHMDIAIEMIKAAKIAGADVIKFQTHIADAEMLSDKNSDTKAASHITKSLYDIMNECHLTLENHVTLKKVAEAEGILFLSTPFSIEAADLLMKVGVPAFKVGSGETTNIPFLKYLAQKKLPIILSTGTANMDEIALSVENITSNGCPLVLMQCTSNYPTAYEDVNLGVIEIMSKKFSLPVGLSDHCQGNYAAFGATALGTCVIEKHFTLSRTLPGVDQSSSIEPNELAELVKGVNSIYKALGNQKELNQEALAVRNGFSESVVSLSDIKSGETLEAHKNIWVKRPGTGIPSYHLDKVIGKRAKLDIPRNSLLRPEQIEGF